MKKYKTKRKVTKRDIAAIRKQIKALPKKRDSARLFVQVALPASCKKETVAYASLLKKKLNKANILACSQPLLYFWDWYSKPDKDYEVMPDQPYDSPYIRVYNLG